MSMDATMEAPRVKQNKGVPAGETLIQVRDLKMYFPVTEGAIIPRVIAHVKAVNGISFDIPVAQRPYVLPLRGGEIRLAD